MQKKLIAMNFNLIQRKNRYSFTIWGWLCLIVMIFALCTFVAKKIHFFLAQNNPIQANIWVVEGHVSDFVLDSVLVNYNRGICLTICTTGIPLEQQMFCENYSNYADLTAASLIYKGIDTLNVISAPCNPVQKDRSYASALALKVKLNEHGYYSGKINIVSQGTHARRTHYLFKKALGDSWKTGIISYSDLSYDPKKWWKSSYGMRSVVYEFFAYVYAVLFFYPKE